MSKLEFERMTLPGVETMVEPIKIIEIGCGIGYDGGPLDDKHGRIYDLPYTYYGIEREEEFAQKAQRLDETEALELRKKSEESGVILGNAADLPFEDESIDIVKMQSVFGQFTGNDFREIDNVRFNGLMEAFRVLKPGGIIAVSEVNTPWDEDNVLSYLNNVGFTVTDYSAMQKAWYGSDSRGFRGQVIGEFRNLYAPENKEWYKKLGQFYINQSWDTFLSSPRQYLMVAQKQQPADIEQEHEWSDWSVSNDIYNHEGSECTRMEKTYKRGQPVKQEKLPGMYNGQRYNQGQQQLFYMPQKYLW